MKVKHLPHTHPPASNPFSFPENKRREPGREEVDRRLRELRMGGVLFRRAMGVVDAQRTGEGGLDGVEVSRNDYYNLQRRLVASGGGEGGRTRELLRFLNVFEEEGWHCQPKYKQQ